MPFFLLLSFIFVVFVGSSFECLKQTVKKISCNNFFLFKPLSCAMNENNEEKKIEKRELNIEVKKIIIFYVQRNV